MEYFNQLQGALAELDKEGLDRLLLFVRACTGTLWLCGNGGSAATAQHWACDLSKAAGRRTQALGSNAAVLTAYSNDISYRDAFAMELERLAQPGDRLLCLSCSGTSPNILAVLQQARALGLPRALVTGAKSPADATLYELCVTVPSENYGIIEDCHLAIGHWLTGELCE